ncbi:MAG: bifunctional riboflavin kinase/FAD synthetase [Candidatus Omnitrophota bacterium]
MKAICEKLPSKKKRYAATIGIFDGIHLGHKFILGKLKKQAEKKGLTPLVITFDMPPQQFLNKNAACHNRRIRKKFLGYITCPQQKVVLLESLGIDCVWFLKARYPLLKLSAKNFIRYIRENFKIEELIIGEDFRFGYGAHAGARYLSKLSLKNNFELQVIKKKKKNKKVISSSLIRELIKEGKLKEVKSFLGRNFSLRGKVIKGEGIGKQIGVPTANIFSSDYIIPKTGVYAALTAVGKKVFLSAVNIGLRPTVTKSKKTIIETHIINFNKNIVGRTIEIIFIKKIREENEFSSLGSLKRAIQKDLSYITSKYSVPSPALPQLLVS